MWLLVSAPIARTTPYASGVANNAGTISFILNESADDVTVIFDGGGFGNTLSLGALAKGAQSFALGAHTTFEIRVTKTTVQGWTQTSDDLNPLVRFLTPRGLCIFNKPSDLARFGRIYVANSTPGTVNQGPVPSRRTVGRGFYALKADQSDALGFGDTAQTGGIAFASSASSPFRIEIGEDKQLYIGDFANANCTIYLTDADLSASAGRTVLAGIGNTANPTVHTDPESSPIARGSLAGGNLQVWAIDGQWSPGGSTSNKNELLRWDIGATALPYNAPPAQLFTNGVATVADITSDLDLAPDGKFFMTQLRAAFTPGVYAPDRVNIRVLANDGLTVLWDSLAQSLANGLTQDVFTNASVIKISEDGGRMAVLRDDAQTWIVNLTNGLPDISSRFLLASFTPQTTSLSRDVSWDAAGNLYALSGSSNQMFRVWSPGGAKTAITRSDGTFQMFDVPTNVTVTATVTTASEAGPVNGVFTLARTGDPTAPLTVNYTVGGSATAGSDYTALPNSVTFAAGAVTTNITVAVNDDTEAEFSETASLTLASGGASYAIGTPASATVNILDNETPVISISGSPANGAVTNLFEDFPGVPAVFPLTRLGSLASATAVNLSYSGAAVRGLDFNGPTNITISVGAATTNLVLAVIDDAEVESPESFTVAINGGGYDVGAPSSASGLVSSEDLPPQLLPAATNVLVGGSAAFTTSNALPPLTFSLATNNSGGSVNASSGLYVAGPLGNVADTLLLTDGRGLTATATVNVLSIETIRIRRSTIDGGGGTSSGETLAVRGAIGQASAGRASSERYSVSGGLWGVLAVVQTPGSPLLRIELTSTNTALIAWPNLSTGFVLQQNSALGTTNWTDVTSAPVVVGGEKQIVVSPSANNRFYRLAHP